VTNASRHSGHVYMSLEATESPSGIEEMSYLESWGLTTGQPPQSLLITHSSTYPFSLGSTGYGPRLSSTRYQWRELYAAWRLATR